MTELTRDSIQCTECQAGVMHLRHITYFTWLNEELVTVPNFPAWICDVCGRREYDAHAISWLVTILDPEAGKVTGKKRPLRPPLVKNDRRRSIQD
jgi:YgiT-type zinc finger domain-containing protein